MQLVNLSAEGDNKYVLLHRYKLLYTNILIGFKNLSVNFHTPNFKKKYFNKYHYFLKYWADKPENQQHSDQDSALFTILSASSEA